MSDDYWLAMPCDYCGAAPGEQCKTASGGRASTHGGRTAVQAAAWRDGYEEGLRDAQEDTR